MKIYELPEEQKYYNVELSNGQTYLINGQEKKVIMNSKTQFIELKTGEVINKSFIVSISLDKAETRDKFNELPEQKKLEIDRLS